MSKANLELRKLFEELDERVNALNLERKKDGAPTLSRAEVKLLGQMSLLVNEAISLILTLAHTGDLDALLKMDSVMKEELKNLLKKYGLVYDEDSILIWIPKGAIFETLFDFKNVLVEVIDPESALVSKAVKAPHKNKLLVREAIASGKFPGLVDRIEENGGNLEFFAKG